MRNLKWTSKCTEDDKYFYSQDRDTYPILQLIENEHKNVNILNTAEYFCGEGVCNMAKDGKLFYRDNNHLNINGSRFVGKKIVENNPQLAH